MTTMPLSPGTLAQCAHCLPTLSNIMSQNVWDNLIANLISTLILSAAGLSTLLLLFIVNRWELFRFFGINRKNPNIRLYLSRIEIKPRGTVGLEEVKEGSRGSAINELEFQAALILRDQFRSKLVGLVPNLFRGWPTPLLALSPLDPVIELSPPKGAGFVHDNLIVIGSGVYNSIAREHLDPDTSCLSFVKDEKTERRALRICRKGMQPLTEWRLIDQGSGPPLRMERGIIRRVNLRGPAQDKKSYSVFICAGMGSGATYGAVKYLNENWRRLYKRYKAREFSLYLTFENLDPESIPTKAPILTIVEPQLD